MVPRLFAGLSHACVWDVGMPRCGKPYEAPEHHHVCEKTITPARRRRVNISQGLRAAILKRDRYRCQLCGASPANDPRVELELDHKIPWSKGGSNSFLNLWALCKNCNREKGVQEMIEEEYP